MHCYIHLYQSTIMSSAAKTTLNDEQRAAVITYKDQNPYASNIDLVNWIRATYQLKVQFLYKKKRKYYQRSFSKKMQA